MTFYVKKKDSLCIFFLKLLLAEKPRMAILFYILLNASFHTNFPDLCTRTRTAHGFSCFSGPILAFPLPFYEKLTLKTSGRISDDRCKEYILIKRMWNPAHLKHGHFSSKLDIHHYMRLENDFRALPQSFT